MTENEILSQLNIIFIRVFENDKIIVTSNSSADDVEEWDSLSHTLMISEVEKHFNVKFKLKELLAFKNVGDMIRCIQTKLQAI